MHLNEEDLKPILKRLDCAHRAADADFPGDNFERQPVHVVYGGAHLFKAGTPARLGAMALNSLRSFADDAADFAQCLGIPRAIADAVYSRVAAKLQHEPVEDYRLDFEDG